VAAAGGHVFPRHQAYRSARVKRHPLPSTTTFTKLRYRFIPDHVIGELLAKKWIDNAIPFLVLICVVGTIGSLIPNFFSGTNLAIVARELGEFGLVCIAMMVVIVVGGIDLSVGPISRLAIS
jgi:ribose transport system permease protein